jgi:AMP-activated protein kinase-like protein
MAALSSQQLFAAPKIRGCPRDVARKIHMQFSRSRATTAIAIAVIALVSPIDRRALAQGSLGASVTRFGDASLSYGAIATLSGRKPLTGLLALTFDASTHGALLRTPERTSSSFAGADVLPAVELSVRRVGVFGGARFAGGYASRATPAPSRPLPPFPSATTSDARVTGALGASYGVSIDASSSPTISLRFGAREDRLAVSGQSIVDRSISASIGGRRANLSGELGRRGASDENSAFHSAALAVAVGDRIAVQLGGGRSASDRLSGLPPQQFVTAGLSVRFNGAPRTPTQIPVAGAPALAPGLIRLSLEAADATSVEVAGDFTQWILRPARRGANGVWYADLRIPPGHYRYAFRVNGKEWRVPRGAAVTEDGFGGKSALLSIDEQQSKSSNSQGGR